MIQMIDINSFGLLGGDRRQAALADALARDGCTVRVWGLEGLPLDPKVKQCALDELLNNSAVVILPLPATADGRTLNAPYAPQPLVLDDAFAERLQFKEVYGGTLAAVYDLLTGAGGTALEAIAQQLPAGRALPGGRPAPIQKIPNFPQFVTD